MKTLQTTVARVLFGLPFVIFGLMHFAFADMMAPALPAWLPMRAVAVMIAGAVLLVSGVAIIINRWIPMVTLALAGFLCSTILMVHIPGLGSPDPMMKQMATTGFLKDIILIGAALLLRGRATSSTPTTT